jgi:hypothetical protein
MGSLKEQTRRMYKSISSSWYSCGDCVSRLGQTRPSLKESTEVLIALLPYGNRFLYDLLAIEPRLLQRINNDIKTWAKGSAT